ncbi:hypothetical protein GCM10008014_52620 [Paenibacillus silvae]|uniref:Uncharacterized protein n=1 Tax=Paenibacillus silvae TaxID=1325358 RepID=A0ABQ1ZML2_9BACL|nr:hypothetical protein [Paenibacillus silvae]GGH69324.1 hypothetical protein GCM10008014_52620 [Paenibacillus silvae]
MNADVTLKEFIRKNEAGPSMEHQLLLSKDVRRDTEFLSVFLDE